MAWKPNKWIAALLALIFPPISMLYLNRVGLAVAYFVGLIGLVAVQFWLIVSGRDFPLSSAYVIVAVIHAFWLAGNTPEIQARPWFTRWYGLIGVTLVATIGVFSVRVFFLEPFRLPSQSMFPSLAKNSFILVKKMGYGNYSTYGLHFFHTGISVPLKRGDILVFESPMDRRVSYVKRLIGLPGDRIEYINKQLYVNDKLLQTKPIASSGGYDLVQEADYKIALDQSTAGIDFNVTVPAGHIFLLGDNRDNSLDSRNLGAIPFENIIGKVIFIFNPRN